MAPPASWWLHRLRAMSPGEVAVRTWRALRWPVDRARMRLGVYARPSSAVRAQLDEWPGPESFYFSASLARTPLDASEIAEADAIVDGRTIVLGLGDLELPAPPWHYEPRARGYWPRIDGRSVLRAAPAGFDARLTWELNRGHGWVVLARAWAATRNVRYGDELAKQLESWVVHNPIGLGINWASPMEAALRLHSLAWVGGFLRGTGDRMLPVIAQLMFAHASFVADHLSLHSSANNHALVELSALVVASRGLGIEDRLWRFAAHDRLRTELDRQILADGVDGEMASHYHAFVLEAVLLVAYLERAHGVRDEHLDRVCAAMAEHLDELVCDGGAVLGYGDSDDGRILPWSRRAHERQLIAAAQALRSPAPSTRPAADAPDSSDHRPACDAASVFWLTGGQRAPARVAPGRSRSFAASGQIVLRGPRLHVVFDAGPFGLGALAAHAHCDCLAILVAIDRRPLIVGRGTYCYNGDGFARARFRATAAHNTVQLGDREQATARGPFLWSRKPDTLLERCELAERGDLVVASHDGFAPVRHRRGLERRGDLLVVRDDLVGARRAQPAVARFHLAPKVEVITTTTDGGTSFTAWRDGAHLATIATNASRARVVRWEHATSYGELVSASTIECELPEDRPLTSTVEPAPAELKP